MPNNSPSDIDLVRHRSLAVIKENQHVSGAFPAATSYSVYRYCWFRDGSFTADALSRIGEVEAATRFHLWCAGVIVNRQEAINDLVRRSHEGAPIAASEMLPTRYTLDGADGVEAWWDYQLDGYGTWLWALVGHLQRHNLETDPFGPAIEILVNYLTAFGAEPCFDWWEEHEQERHVSTLASVAAGLQAVTEIADPATSTTAGIAAKSLQEMVVASASSTGYLTKWLGSDAVDGSLLSSLVPFGVVEPGSDLAEATYAKIVDSLLRDGVYRYLGDIFYGGGEWIILTAWLGWYEVITGRLALAQERRDWIAQQATAIGDLPEQVSAATQAPQHIERWREKWGTVATPLLWSHAMFLILDDAIGNYESAQ